MVSRGRGALPRQPCGPSTSPLDQLDDNEVIAVARVEQEKPVGGRGLKLEEEMHGGIGLERGERQVAAAALEGDGIGHDGPQAEASVELAVGDVTVLTLVHVGLAVEHQPAQVPDEVGGHHGDEAALRHDARLDVMEFQPCMGSCHLSCSGPETEMRWADWGAFPGLGLRSPRSLHSTQELQWAKGGGVMGMRGAGSWALEELGGSLVQRSQARATC